MFNGNNTSSSGASQKKIDLTKIINDEKWYESERRHCETYTDDMELKRRVYQIMNDYNADINTKRLFDKFTLL